MKTFLIVASLLSIDALSFQQTFFLSSGVCSQELRTAHSKCIGYSTKCRHSWSGMSSGLGICKIKCSGCNSSPFDGGSGYPNHPDPPCPSIADICAGAAGCQAKCACPLCSKPTSCHSGDQAVVEDTLNGNHQDIGNDVQLLKSVSRSRCPGKTAWKVYNYDLGATVAYCEAHLKCGEEPVTLRSVHSLRGRHHRHLQKLSRPDEHLRPGNSPEADR